VVSSVNNQNGDEADSLAVVLGGYLWIHLANDIVLLPIQKVLKRLLQSVIL
jgi:hypothetical protein